MGKFSAIVGGVIFARWGSKKGRTNELPALDKLPEDMRTGIISLPGQRPSVGRATTSPSSIVPAVVATYILPLIILFVVGLAFCLVLFFYVAPRVIEHGWFERAVFS